MRQRFNPNAICSSSNYRASKRVHKQYLKDTHNKRMQAISLINFSTPVGSAKHYGRPYINSWGRRIDVPMNKVKDLEQTGFTIHYE